MKKIRVYGQLRKFLGQGTFEFDVATPAEAIKALLVNFPKLEKWLRDSQSDGIGYRVKVGTQKIVQENIEDLTLPWSERDVFTIAPVLSGSAGWSDILWGAALIGVALVFPGAALGTIGTFGGAGIGVSTIVGGIGVALTLGGISKLLTPTPKPPEEAERFQSFTFNGIDNVAQQGLPVPVIFGRCFVGSHVLTTSLDVDQVR